MAIDGIGGSFGSDSPSPLTALATTGASARDMAASLSGSAPLPADGPPWVFVDELGSTRWVASISLMILLPLF